MKKIDDELGGTTPLNIIIKISSKRKKNKMNLKTMNFLNGKKKKMRKIKLNIGLQETKWTKY